MIDRASCPRQSLATDCGVLLMAAIGVCPSFSWAVLPDSPAAKPKAASGKPAGDGERQPQATSTLVVRSDADCDLAVNGTSMGRVTANATRAVKVTPGEQLVECRGSSGAVAQQTKSVASGAQTVVDLAMPRFARLNNEVVVDSQTGLHWTQSDNGTDINWNDAGAWCSGKGSGWRLPSSHELGSLVGRPAPFRFTGRWYWTNERKGSSEAWGVVLADGARDALGVGFTSAKRALCVRRS